MRLTWLPAVLRDAGLTVTEVSGWATRGLDTMLPLGVLCHATAGSRTASTSGEISVLVNGSATAPPPIAQLYLARDGSWHVVASGLCYHAGRGYWPATVGPNPGISQDNGNPYLIGIEAGNNKVDEPWSPVQYASYVRGVAAICRHLGWPVTRILGHKEWSRSGKTDPTFSMSDFRARVTTVLGGQLEDDMTPEELAAAPVPKPDDITIPGVGNTTPPFTKPLAWWLGAQYQHILGAENAAKVAAAVALKAAALEDQVASLRQAVEALGATLTAPVQVDVDLDTLAGKIAERILAEVGPDAIAQRIADRLGNG